MGQARKRFGWWAGVAIGIGSLGVATTTGAGAGLDVDPAEWSSRFWEAAREGDRARIDVLLDQAPEVKDGAPAERLRSLSVRLEANWEQQEAQREERLAEVREELAEAAGEEGDLSEALGLAVEMQVLTHEDPAVLEDELVKGVIERAEREAFAAEAEGDWLHAYELFYRLNSLYDVENRYEEDLKRQAARLSMVQLYTPERWWEMRNEELTAEGEDPLPPYNAMGQSFEEKLEGIDLSMMRRAVLRGYGGNVDGIGLGEMVLGGLEAIRTMLTTSDLKAAFPGFADQEAKNRMLEMINQQTVAIQEKMRKAARDEEGGRTRFRGRSNDGVDNWDLTRTLDKLLTTNSQTVEIPEEAILHEFGNGAMGRLDDFSGIIWPEDWSRFQRSTRGSFVGVGIQIELDERRRIRVVTPLDGTPAQRAGIIAGDVIVGVNGEPTLGFTLDQAVDVITGPRNTEVKLTVERNLGVGEEDVKRLTFEITRREIELVTVKGWERSGRGEHDWEWFIDREAGIGYVRLTNFDEKTARDFDLAIREMREVGLNGLILDLRYNPGGLLDQAVEIANRFIGVDDARIVTTHQEDRIVDVQLARARKASLADVPAVVLINEGSASASEIVAGAIHHYAERGEIPAVVVGRRSYGKGSVQNVYPLTNPTTAAVKVTTQQYRLPGGEWIHRKPGAKEWGVDPHLEVELLPKQIARSLAIRRQADLYEPAPIPVAEGGEEVPADPDAILEEGVDLQLETALVLLEAKALTRSRDQAMLDAPVSRPGG